MQALLGRFVPSLRAEQHPCTSGTVKRGVGAFVRHCGGRAFLPTKMESNAGGDAERLGKSAQPLRRVLPPLQPRFRQFGLRQNAQGKGRAEGSIFQRDKFWDTSARSADSQINAFCAVGRTDPGHRRDAPLERKPTRLGGGTAETLRWSGSPPAWVGQASRPAIRRPHSPGRCPGTPCP